MLAAMKQLFQHLRPGRGRLAAAGAALLLWAGAAPAAAAPSVGGCPVYPADNVWNTDISGLPVHARSAAWTAGMGGASKHLHPDFGSSGDPSAPYGIPFTVVPGSHPKVPVSFDYSDESDPGPYPLGSDTPIEGGANADGDRHALMIDSSTCRLYELYDTHYSAGGSTAGSGAVFDLRANGPLRPSSWTSADAAGLPIFPGLLRLEEVNAGSVNHAIRFTANRTDRSFIWPARHQAGAANDPSLPPMGARFRLRASYDTSHVRPDTRAVLEAMKHYGMILADNGSDWYFTGAASNSWNDDMLDQLKAVPASAFDAIDESSLMLDQNSGQARSAGVARPPVPGPKPPVQVAPAGPAVTLPAPSEPSMPTTEQARRDPEAAGAIPAVVSEGAGRAPGISPGDAAARGAGPPPWVPIGLAAAVLALSTGAGILVGRRHVTNA
ncbi:MAG: hypothetical protein QOE92_323 [Chloroflexota bacterium]|nr:hypothetical protein [Chloroflexota bacterium]